MATLTKRQKQLVDYLENYINEHGYAPTLAEVGEFSHGKSDQVDVGIEEVEVSRNNRGCH